MTIAKKRMESIRCIRRILFSQIKVCRCHRNQRRNHRKLILNIPDHLSQWPPNRIHPNTISIIMTMLTRRMTRRNHRPDLDRASSIQRLPNISIPTMISMVIIIIVCHQISIHKNHKNRINSIHISFSTVTENKS